MLDIIREILTNPEGIAAVAAAVTGIVAAVGTLISELRAWRKAAEVATEAIEMEGAKPVKRRVSATEREMAASARRKLTKAVDKARTKKLQAQGIEVL